MSFFNRIFGDSRRRERLAPLYHAVVATARDPVWFREGQVPDTIDGRFDMVAAILALVLIRLEREEDCREDSVLLTETFVADMDGTLRQIGIGDFVVGKHVGRMMGALGGRLAAFRTGPEDEAAFAASVQRNIFRDSPPSPDAVPWLSARLRRFRDALDGQEVKQIIAGALPKP